VAVLLLLAGCGKPDQKEEAAKAEKTVEGQVVLSEEQVKSLGITTEPAKAAQFRAGLSGYGTVVSLDTIGQTDSDILSAQAVAAQSQAAAIRAQNLFASGVAVSREAMEAAQSKAAADQAALALAQRKAEAIFGHNPPWEGGNRRAIMARLTSGRTVLVRVTFPLGSLERRPTQLTVARMGKASRSWPAAAIWDAPADPAFPGPGILVLVDGSDLAQNDHVIATVPVGAPVTGVTVPAAALVYSEDRAWVYSQIAPRTYRRVPVDAANATADGYFVPGNAGLAPGAAIVTTGAGLVLARERNPSTEPEE
jgi:hypothetical protein